MTDMDIPHVLLSSLERAPWGWTMLLVIIGALIKVWPIINAQLIDVKNRIADRREKREEAARVEKRDDLDDCKIRLDAMDERLNMAEIRAHNFELKLIGTLTAYRILEADVETNEPQSAALKQARRVLQDVYQVVGSVPSDMTATAMKAN